MSNNSKKSKKKLILIVSLIIFLIAVPLISFLVNKKGGNKVSTYTISNNADNCSIINGVVYPKETENIYLDPSKGNDYSIKVKEDAIVSKGDTLIIYNGDTLNSKISLAESQMKDNKNQINLLDSEYKKIPSPANESIKEKIKAIKDTIKASEIELKELKKQKENLTIKSPIDGKVSAINLGNNNPSNPIITIESIDKIIKGSLTEYELPNIKTSTPCKVNFKAIDKKYYTSKIVKINNNPSNDAPTGMPNGIGASPKVSNYDILFKVPDNFKDKLQNGFHALIKIGNVDKKIVFPKNAVYKDVDNTHKLVWIIKDKKVYSKNVEVKEDGKNYALVSGLDSGATLIVDAPKNLKEEDEVTLKQ
ncbi:efflux RND transporter periplasmic adaptor subunit [Clostridium massiliodielmoense]|uniref:efflux RND transporter periplasmic adaptor subunit n=1 Tax=Clostridium massiliodielmoense TaxID=1776385 RepID=UPI0004D954E9|nr:efflux RND transporter periplasmic adaptor subunit [Clostridium massiliodielmoense]KEH93713.1 RND transporter [Clostridium botulinum C/D str. BKT12695]